jgi:hypothetical protein
VANSNGCSGRAEESVSGGCDFRKRRAGNFAETDLGNCSGRAKRWQYGTISYTKAGRDSRSDVGFFISDGTGVKGVRPMGKGSMALLDLLGFCMHLTWIL